MDDVFVPIKVDSQMVLDVLFIQSSSYKIINYIQIVRLQDKKVAKILLTLPFFIDIEELMRSLILFVLAIDPSSDPDPFTVVGIPVKSRQNLLRQCRLIDLLIDCLRYPFNDGLYFFNELTSASPITRICRLIYRLLKYCVVESPVNKTYVGK